MANYKELHIPNKEVAKAFADAWNKSNGGGNSAKKKKPTTNAKKPVAKSKK